MTSLNMLLIYYMVSTNCPFFIDFPRILLMGYTETSFGESQPQNRSKSGNTGRLCSVNIMEL